MFKLIYQTKHGDTVASDNPKLDALKQAAYIQNFLGLSHSITYHKDKSVTVKDLFGRLAPITFEKESMP